VGDAFAGFVLMVELAANCDPPGTLVHDDGRPMTAADMAAATGAPERFFTAGLLVCCHPEIKWMEAKTVEGDACAQKKTRSTAAVGSNERYFDENVWPKWREYMRYPDSKKLSKKAFLSRVKEGCLKEELLKAVENYGKAMNLEHREEQTRLRGYTFFGPNERWVPYKDGVPEVIAQGNPQKAGDYKNEDSGAAAFRARLSGKAKENEDAAKANNEV